MTLQPPFLQKPSSPAEPSRAPTLWFLVVGFDSRTLLLSPGLCIFLCPFILFVAVPVPFFLDISSSQKPFSIDSTCANQINKSANLPYHSPATGVADRLWWISIFPPRVPTTPFFLPQPSIL